MPNLAAAIPLVLGLILFSNSSLSDDLLDSFDSPAPQHKPWAFWYWINGNITKEGINADLQAMSEAGLGGVILMHINEHEMVPAGPIRFLSEQYKEVLKYTFETAQKYNIQVNLYNSEGWSVAGGPWITAEMGMKELAWSELNIGNKNQAIVFGKPHAPLGYYQDIATLAFPTPVDFIEPDFTTLLDNIVVSGKASERHSAVEGQLLVDKD
ncbi:glycosyl hydrolase [Glaciecola sp. SC05]|uniref:glycosyl hydrolase n=1 Tax=Glaciecola sp. SC05 TaxID=1987355 RepID=UPI00352801CF